MYYNIIVGVILLIILISVQYTLNKILVELRNIKKAIYQMKIRD